ncbi:MAG TPA: hypothetical protein VF155_00880 [Candidatus Dormibacteraeota bacterium]
MSDPFPERPDLDQLRRRAKELQDAARDGDATALRRVARHYSAEGTSALSLAAAQLVVARELGFPSWPKLKAACDARVAADRQLARFLTASVSGRVTQASDILRAEPRIADRNLLAATVLGDAGAVQTLLAADPQAATAIDDVRGWPPLLYACYSRWHEVDATRASGIADVVRLLLDAGADPNTNDGGRPRYRSALKGSVEVDNPAVTEALLDAGANPDAGQPIGEAAAHRHHRCLELLLAHGARVTGTWAVDGAVHADDPEALALLFDALTTTGAAVADIATEHLTDHAGEVSLQTAVALLDAGADPRALDAHGVSTLRRAVRAGSDDVVARLRAAGAPDDSTDVDRFIGACLRADRTAVDALLAANPGLREQLSDADRSVIVDAAAAPTAAPVALMLDVGFTPHARNELGEQPLHIAAYHGRAATVRLLLHFGAAVAARDGQFDGTPLAFATVGSGEQAGKPGDWVETVRLLLRADAPKHDVWVAGKPPSPEVQDILRRHGIGPDTAPDNAPDEQPGNDGAGPDELGTGVLADIARQLDTAYRERDFELLASLFHPDVRWTGVCNNRAQVLEWYRGLVADDTIASVESVEVDRNAVVLGLAVSRRAEGARPAPGQHLYQVFTVDGAEIVDIRGYADRQSALTRD